MQIIVAALAFAIAAFFVVAVVVGRRAAGAAAQDVPIVTYCGIAFAGVGAVGSYLLPKLLGGKVRQSFADGTWSQEVSPSSQVTIPGDVGALASSYQTQTIIGAALLEGTAFINLVAYMVERQQISLAMAGALFLLLLTKFPTFGRLRNRIEDDLTTLKQLPAMGSRHGG